MTAGIDPIPREAREYQGRRAGVVTRLAAGVIDIGVVALILIIGYLGVCIALFLLPPKGVDPPVPPLWLDLILGYVVMALYLAVSWRTGGRSYGCHVMGLRVVGRKGQRLRWATSVLRAAFLVAFPLGFFWVVISKANRSVQDVVLRSSVIYDWDVRPQVQPLESEAS
jgi:uncharacterized RDD family membrane protein YckC